MSATKEGGCLCAICLPHSACDRSTEICIAHVPQYEHSTPASTPLGYAGNAGRGVLIAPRYEPPYQESDTTTHSLPHFTELQVDAQSFVYPYSAFQGYQEPLSISWTQQPLFSTISSVPPGNFQSAHATPPFLIAFPADASYPFTEKDTLNSGAIQNNNTRPNLFPSDPQQQFCWDSSRVAFAEQQVDGDGRGWW